MRLGAAVDSNARISATLRPAPPPGRSTTDTSYKGTPCSSSCARSFRRRYSTGEVRIARRVLIGGDQPLHGAAVTRVLQVEYRVEQHTAKLGDRQAREGADRGVGR